MDYYWSKDENKYVTLIRNIMSRNRFRSIKHKLHLADLNLDPSDKCLNLRSFSDLLNQKFVQFSIFTRSLSID